MNSHEHHAEHHMVEGEESLKEYLKFAFVIVGIGLLAWWSAPTYNWQELMRTFMGWFFVVFAAFKLTNVRLFAAMFAGYDIVARRFRFYGYAYPFIELALGLYFLLDVIPLLRSIATLVIMGVGAVGIIQQLRQKNIIKCACLGNVIKLPLSTVSLSEDVLMGAMAAVMLLTHIA